MVSTTELQKTTGTVSLAHVVCTCYSETSCLKQLGAVSCSFEGIEMPVFSNSCTFIFTSDVLKQTFSFQTFKGKLFYMEVSPFTVLSNAKLKLLRIQSAAYYFGSLFGL